MDNDSLVLQNQACSLTEDESGSDTSKTTGFLRLPLELRQKVYRELLGPFKTNGFQTSILRVSKGIHNEAAEIFYGENSFVMYHVHRKLLGQLRPITQSYLDFPSDFSLYPVTGADGRIGFEPKLTVDIALQQSCSSAPDGQWQDEWERYVGFSGTVSHLCQVLTSCHIRNSLRLRLSLPPMAENRRSAEHSNTILLDCFPECRGVGTAEIFTVGGLPVSTDLSSLMEKPLESFDEILTRGRWYQDQVRQELAGRHHANAMQMLERALSFFGWWNVNRVELSNETDEKWTEFWDMTLEAELLYSVQLLQHGEPDKAREAVKVIFSMHPLLKGSGPVPRRLWDKEGEGHYILGLCSLAEGCKICALYEFLQALIRKPGYETVDKEIDKLEAAIEKSESPDDEIVRWNIKYVMGRFRHQPLLDPSLDADDHKHRGPADMTADDQYKLEDSFVQSFAHPAGCKLTRYARR